MTEVGWRESMVAYIRVEAQPADKFGHQPRLYALATRIGQGMDYDDGILFAGTWMHDLGVFVGHRPRNPEGLACWDHVPYTIARSRELLRGWGFPAEKLDAVADAIQNHQSTGEPEKIEATILHDADILEQLGAVGAMRTIVKVGRDTRYPTFSSVLPVLYRAVNHLPHKLRLISSMSMAEPRIEVLRSFIAAVEEEAGDLLQHPNFPPPRADIRRLFTGCNFCLNLLCHHQHAIELFPVTQRRWSVHISEGDAICSGSRSLCQFSLCSLFL